MPARRLPLTLAVWLIAALTLAGCRSSSTPAPGASTPQFTAYVDEFLGEFARMYPSAAAASGLHQHDGTLEDFSAEGVRAQVATWRRLQDALQAIPVDGLTADERVDHRILRGVIDAWLLDLETVKSWQRNPMVYASAVTSGVGGLMTSQSSPADVRARHVVAKLAAVPQLLAAADANLANPPRVLAERGMEMFRDASTMLRRDLPLAFAGVDDAALAASLAESAAAAATAIDAFVARYERERLPKAAGDHALGREALEARFRAEELIDLSAPQLLAIGERELLEAERAFVDAAARIDRHRHALALWEETRNDHPPRGGVAAAAQETLNALQAFVTTKGLVSLPSSEPVIAAAAPAYDHGLAWMHVSPPLASTPSGSVFYVTDAAADWEPARQAAWLQQFNRPALAVLGAREAMPGRYVHSVFTERTPGRVRRAWNGLGPFPHASSGQSGWAHYAEQLVFDEGFMADDPRYRMMQLSEAITRICRLIAGVQLHSGGWSVDEAAKLFELRAHMPPQEARREAERGVYAPTYGGEFLGRLAVLKLRDDVRVKEAASFDLRRFHERVMTNGVAPWWAHRQLLLPGDAASVLQ